MDKNVDDKTILRSVIDLTNNLGMKAVAGGVKNREIYGPLRVMDLYWAQRYYISRPVEEERFNGRLNDPRWGEPAPGAA